ncbi:MAG: LptF/LptG family permease [Verrucomicrobia bacterium]|nr:LptF/LptG family permease [Verrucomicrobiota bacterium]
MRLLDRYLLRELLVPLGYCLGGFFLFWVSFDLVAEMADFQKRRLGVSDIAEYYACMAPEFLAVVLPVAFLLALLYALTNHARHQELTAMRAAGISVWRMANPYLAVGLGLSVILLAINETWAPHGAEAAEQVLARRAEDRQAASGKTVLKLGFRNARDRRNWYMAAFNLVTHEMLYPHVTWTLPNGSMQEIYADRAVWEDGRWVFGAVRTNVQVLLYPPGQGQIRGVRTFETNRLAMPAFTETPEAIKTEIKVQKMNNLRRAQTTELSIREIQEYLRLHPDEQFKRSMLETKLHGRIAAPWTCLVVVLIALPFGAAPGRRNVFVGVASSILICFTYFVMGQLALAFGARGTLPSFLAAWSPNLLFGLGGLWLTWRIR